MSKSHEDKVREALAAVRNLPAAERDRIIEAAKSLKSMSMDDLAKLTSSPGFAACGPCDPCSPSGEIGIEGGY